MLERDERTAKLIKAVPYGLVNWQKIERRVFLGTNLAGRATALSIQSRRVVSRNKNLNLFT